MPTLHSLYPSFTERYPAYKAWADVEDIVSSYEMTMEACISLDHEEETSE